MRLINARTLELKEFRGQSLPRYAIVSHRWENEEITYDVVRQGNFRSLEGYYKLEGAAEKALEYGCDWVWLDTCCIDKSSSAELTESINSMYNWYKNSYICLAYLHDCRFRGDLNSLRDCEWFRRGWTLQELIAPAHVVFFDRDYEPIGTKAKLADLIAQITSIDINVLRGADPTRFSVAQRFSWASNRRTTQIEDQAYSLLGLFNVSMPMVYGEGQRAFARLQEEIMRYSNDQTIFAWDRHFPKEKRSGLLAHSPACFDGCHSVVQAPRQATAFRAAQSLSAMQGFSMTNIGISITLMTVPYAMNTYLAILDCCSLWRPHIYYGILLEKLGTAGQFVRVEIDDYSIVSIDMEAVTGSKALRTRPLLIRQNQIDQPLQQNYAFWLRSLDVPGYSRSEISRAKVYSRNGDLVRCDGGTSACMQLPNGVWGSAGLVRIRPRDSDTPWWRVEYLVFGFDHDFIPYCMLGNCRLGLRSQTFVKKVVDRNRGSADGYSNSWLYKEPSPPTRFDFKRDDHTIVKATYPNVEPLKIDFLNVTISFKLVYTPERLSGLKTAPWTVWAVDVAQANGPHPQVMANQDQINRGATSLKKTMVTDLPKGIKQAVISQAVLGSMGLEALADLDF